MTGLRAGQWADELLEPGWTAVGAFRPVPDGSMLAPRPDDQYAQELQAARSATRLPESVLIAAGRVRSVEVLLLAWEFSFLAGSVGVQTAARVVGGVRAATEARRPLLVVTRSGGTRMQEGAAAFFQMAPVAAAVDAHRRAGLPVLVHLDHPTAGGVLASLGSLGDLTTASPGALVGFLGPRVIAALTGAPFPEGVQRAENLAQRGVIDSVASPSQLRDMWGELLRSWSGRPRLGCIADPGPLGSTRGAQTGARGFEGGAGSDPELVGAVGVRRPAGGPADPQALWSDVLATRCRQRPGAADLAHEVLGGAVAVRGTGAGESSDAVVVRVGRIADVPVVLVGWDDRRSGLPLGPSALRVARRGIALAGRWGLPIVTVVDTLGGELSVAAEQGAIAGEIARTTTELAAAPVPTLAILLGAGTGGAALSLLVADRVVAASRSWVSPLPPEGAAVIRHRDPGLAAAVAWEQGIDAHALAVRGLVDQVVAEGADPVAAMVPVVAASMRELVAGWSPAGRLARFAAWAAGAQPHSWLQLPIGLP